MLLERRAEAQTIPDWQTTCKAVRRIVRLLLLLLLPPLLPLPVLPLLEVPQPLARREGGSGAAMP